jgi:Ca2+-transporting ATPase
VHIDPSGPEVADGGAGPTDEPWRLDAADVARALAVDPARGLSVEEAEERRRRVGANELDATPPVPAWRRLLDQFADPLIYLLLGAVVVSFAAWLVEGAEGVPFEVFVILTIVVLNAVLGYVQEARAEQAVAALRRMAAAHAQVVRGGRRRSIEAAEVVPGDILLLEEGDTVSADARLIRCAALQTAEAALTGESLPESKQAAPLGEEAALGDRSNMVFSGTAVTHGRGRAVVVATGMATQMGRIAGMLKEAPVEVTPLQKELDRVGRRLGLIVVAIAVVMIATIILFEHVRGWPAIFDVLILGIALAVAAVPEGLPAVVTAVLSLGVQRMAKRNAIMRHLAAVETLGSANIIASDKTGTLTKNEMTVRAVVTASGRVDFGGTGYVPEGRVSPVNADQRIELMRALTVGDRANNAALHERDGRWSVQGDPTEGALLVAARKAGLAAGELEQRFKRIGEVPFDSGRKLMTTLHTDAERGGRVLAFTKGAPDVLLGRCTHELVGPDARPLEEKRRSEILGANESLAREALRTLGVAFRTLPADAEADESLERELVFAGLIGMIDPPRGEAKQAVARARAAGIRPVMITGDHPATAQVIGKELGVAEIHARVAPEDKLRIVTRLQAEGHIVAMTGDGVNDAPALKRADIGVAMGITGTDVSKEAADIVLADDNFATIVAAVEEGRAIFANIRKFLRYLLSSNIGEVMTMFFGVLLAGVIGLTADTDGGLVLPLLATQILWINLVTDGAPALALGVDPADAGVMNQPPRPQGEGVITRRMWAGILFVGAVMAVGTLIVLDASLPGGLIEGSGGLGYAQTMAFTTLMLFQLFNVVNARSDERSAFSDLFTNPWLWAAIALSVLLHMFVLYVPFLQQAFSTVSLSASDWLACAAVASSVLWLREASKAMTRATMRVDARAPSGA